MEGKYNDIETAVLEGNFSEFRSDGGEMTGSFYLNFVSNRFFCKMNIPGVETQMKMAGEISQGVDGSITLKPQYGTNPVGEFEDTSTAGDKTFTIIDNSFEFEGIKFILNK